MSAQVCEPQVTQHMDWTWTTSCNQQLQVPATQWTCCLKQRL